MSKVLEVFTSLNLEKSKKNLSFSYLEGPLKISRTGILVAKEVQRTRRPFLSLKLTVGGFFF